MPFLKFIWHNLVVSFFVVSMAVGASWQFTHPHHPAPAPPAPYHSQCSRATGECYDPGADYTPAENDPQYYGY